MNKLTPSQILKMRLDGLTYQQIGGKANVSRQRIQQILSPPKEIRDYILKKFNNRCSDCGVYVGKQGHIHHENGDRETYNNTENLFLLCLACHRHRHRIYRTCKYCGRKIMPTGTSRRYCNNECRINYHKEKYFVRLTCPICNVTFELARSVAKYWRGQNSQRRFFCSQKCLGRWLGQTYGFGARLRKTKAIIT